MLIPARLLKRLRAFPAIAVLVGLLSGLFIIGLHQLGLLQALELLIYDRLLQSRTHLPNSDGRLVLIGITDEDFEKYGWPLRDAVLADALVEIARAEPRAIGLDIYRDLAVPPGRNRLNAVLTKFPFIICVTNLVGIAGRPLPPPPVLSGTEQVGFNDLVPDPDGIVRRALLFQDDGDGVAFAFALRLALHYLEAEDLYPEPDPFVPEHLKLGQTTFVPFESSDGGYVRADAGGYQILVDYQGPEATASLFSLEALLSGEVDERDLKNKVVLVGITALGSPDLVNIPFGMIHGVDVHAHIVSQLLGAALNGRTPIRTVSETAEILWTLSWGLAGGLAGLALRSLWRFVAGGVLGLAVLILITGWAFTDGLWMPPGSPGLAWFVALSLVTAAVLKREREDRALLRQLFGQHLSEKVAEAIWAQRERFLAGGRPPSQQVTATILFADFKGYTAVSEKMDSQALVDWLDTYLAAMSKIVMEHGGFVDDYAGDAIKANFFNPVKAIGGDGVSGEEIAQDARRAVTCALAMEQEMHRLNALHETAARPTVGMRIGIETGPVVAGTVGSTHRMKYTTVGDTVNTAARLESLDREGLTDTGGKRVCRILIGETTSACLDESFRSNKVGEVTVKGKTRAVTVFQVLPDEQGARPGE